MDAETGTKMQLYKSVLLAEISQHVMIKVMVDVNNMSKSII